MGRRIHAMVKTETDLINLELIYNVAGGYLDVIPSVRLELLDGTVAHTRGGKYNRYNNINDDCRFLEFLGEYNKEGGLLDAEIRED